ncbi:MAG: lysine--tRNA ligase [Acidobacteria bacterium]|nr:MAG: lysine--tRNA ligase [Acidobacteriota bacterium]
MEPLEQIRIQKLQQIKELGVEAYPTYYRYTHTLAEVVRQFSAKTAEELEQSQQRVRVAGRILTNRPFGKAGFVTLSDGEGQLQIYAKKDRLPERDFQLYKLFDIGDFVGVEGTLFRTKTGELTVLAGELTFLAKCFLPLPEKWHGLRDIEIRYRQRYVDLVVNREVRDVFVKRGVIIRELRRFLDDREYLEVETPILHPIAGGALAKPFKTHHNALDMSLYLRIAPELYLKRLIVGGLNRVYDLNRIFRNEGISTRHNPEFTMLEFYQAYSNYADLMDLTEEMLAGIAEKVCGSRVITYDDQQIDFRKWTRLSMKEAILKFSPEKIDEEGLRNRAAVEALLKRLHAEFDPKLPLGNLIGLLFETLAEQHLIQPTFIYDYPVELSPLSKQKASDPSLVERFELYIGGMEIANGYSELNDPIDQRERFLSQLQQRERGDEEAHQMDEDYIRALSYGMPPTAGEGIGVDRLTMLLTNSTSIRDVILFPHLRAE